MEKIVKEEDVQKIALQFKIPLILKSIETFINPLFLNYKKESNGLWEKDGPVFFLLKNLNLEEVEEIANYINDLRKYENFPFGAISTKIGKFWN